MHIYKLHVPPSGKSPEFNFKPSGNLTIRGRAMLTDRKENYDQIMKWLDQYLEDPADMTYVIVALEYLNSFSTTFLASLFMKISRVMIRNKKYSIQWYYEDGDDDMLERGQYIATAHKISIRFIPVEDINSI
jgi:hypothetical protein